MLEFNVSRSINVSQIVDLFKFESGEFSNGVRCSFDVEMGYYIAKGVVRVLGDTVFPYIRFWKCIIKVGCLLIQYCQVLSRGPTVSNT